MRGLGYPRFVGRAGQKSSRVSTMNAVGKDQSVVTINFTGYCVHPMESPCRAGA